MTSPLASLLSPSLVQLDLPAGSGPGAIRAVAASLAGHPAMRDVGQFTEEVLAREKLSPTALGNGVAFPHARTGQVREIVVAVGRSREGVDFDAGGEAVHLIFVIGTPLDKVAQYLALVGQLVRLLKKDGVRAQLLQATSAEEFLAPFQASA